MIKMIALLFSINKVHETAKQRITQIITRVCESGKAKLESNGVVD